jgi:hypothetical protein
VTSGDPLDAIKQIMKIVNTAIENLSKIASDLASKHGDVEPTDYKITISQNAKDKIKK